MLIFNLFRIITLTILFVSVNADHCDDLKLNITPYIEKCILNDNKELIEIELDVENKKLSSYDKIFNYTTINKLKLEYVSLTQDIIEKIVSLPNLNDLTFYNSKFKDNLDMEPLNSIPNIYLKDCKNFEKYNSLKNIKEIKFTVYEKIDQSIIDILPNFSRLENLYFEDSRISQLNLDALKNIKNLKSLEISYTDLKTLPDIIYSLTNLKSLTIKANDDSSISISDKIFDLINLEELHIENNLSKISENFGNFKNLKTLNLSNNIIKNIPKEIGNLSKLETLEMRSNNISELPIELENLQNLKILDLTDNKLKKLPEWIGKFSNLEELLLSYNDINSEIPKSYNNLTKLKKFDISDNTFIKGKILTMDSLKECYYDNSYDICKEKDVKCIIDEFYEIEFCSDNEADIDVSTNGKCDKESGKCPSGQCCGKDGKCGSSEDYCYVSRGCQSQFGYCINGCEELFKKLEEENFSLKKYNILNCKNNKNEQIKSLYLENVKIDQSFVDYLGKLKDIEEWGCDYCMYEDHVNFDEFENLDKLSLVSIRGTSNEEGFTDIPKFIKKFPNLKKLIFNDNNLNNAKDIWNLKSLEYLDIKYNNIEKIPDEIKNLENLKYIDLSDNFIKKIPESLCRLKNLENLNLNYNEITKIPDNIKNLKHLIKIDLSDNNLTDISSELYSIQNITSLNLGDNSELNKISDKLINLEELTYLNIGSTGISSLPSLENLKNLKHFDASGNKLTIFPEGLDKIQNIEFIDLSYNNIFDYIPESFDNLNKLEYIYLDDNLNIKGRTLTNENLKECTYSSFYDLCEAKEIPCLDISFESCGSGKEPKISTDGKCGKEHGRCPSGQCCNNGKCGSGDDQCYVTRGCDGEYGYCVDECYEIAQFDKENCKDDYSHIFQCQINKKGKVSSLYLKEFYNDNIQDYVDKLASFTDIEKIYFIDALTSGVRLDSFKNNTKLTSLSILGYSNAKSLKEIPEAIYSLTSLEELVIEDSKIATISDSIKNLKNLKILSLASNSLTEIPSALGSLVNLESLSLNDNKIYSKIPKSFYNLTKLKYLNLDYNLNIKGKILDLDNLEECYYNTKYSLCKPKDDLYCFQDNYSFPECKDNYDDESSVDDECEKLYQYINENQKSKNYRFICYINDQGKAKEITIENDFENLQHIIDMIVKLTDIEKLEFLNINYESGLDFNGLKNLTKLNELIIEDHNTEALREIPSVIYSLTSLKKLRISDQEITKIQDSIGNLVNLEELDLSYNLITNLPKTIGNLKNLEVLYLQSNNIDAELPESYNDLSKLRLFYIYNNKDIRGKVLTNDSLEECDYDEEYNLCIVNENSCVNSYITYELCSEIVVDDTQVSSDYRCGKGKGRCPEGQCCSKYGWCGISSQHCSVDSGCQSEFGECKTSSTTKVSVNGKCGAEAGRCPEGECCSKNGECGTSEDHCSVDTGCQSEFGKCINKKISVNGRCGLEYGSCPEGKCCSKYGWCGSDIEHCASTNGCQSEFGNCNSESNYIKGKCGEGYGKCPSGQCCSKYGWCGKGKNYCGVGCDSDFGECN